MPRRAGLRAHERSKRSGMNKAPPAADDGTPEELDSSPGPQRLWAAHPSQDECKGPVTVPSLIKSKSRLRPTAVERGRLHGSFAGRAKTQKRGRGEELITTGHGLEENQPRLHWYMPSEMPSRSTMNRREAVSERHVSAIEDRENPPERAGSSA